MNTFNSLYCFYSFFSGMEEKKSRKRTMAQQIQIDSVAVEFITLVSKRYNKVLNAHARKENLNELISSRWGNKIKEIRSSIRKSLKFMRQSKEDGALARNAREYLDALAQRKALFNEIKSDEDVQKQRNEIKQLNEEIRELDRKIVLEITNNESLKPYIQA